MSPAHPYEATSIQLPTDEWIRKMWYVHVMEYLSSIKINEVLKTYAATWMQLRNVKLSEK